MSPAAEPLASSFNRLLGLIHGRFSGESLLLLHEHSMTMAQLVALHTLAFKGGQNISALASGLHLGLSSTSHLVDQLVRKGFVLRSEDPQDRRQKRVQLSPAGQALIDHLQATRLAEFDAAFSTLDPALQHQLGELLERVVAELIPQTCCEEGP